MSWEKYLNKNRFRESTREVEIEKDPRNQFESDFGRVVFSPAIRRMHDKTQVFPLTNDDNIHSRLTHSMEVMVIGQSLGLRLCDNEEFVKKTDKSREELLREIPVLLKSACLVHDIGNPPFGHFGETVIKEYFNAFFKKGHIDLNLTSLQQEDFIHFDGNAQGFRILTKLQVLDDHFGLNLTFGTLGAFLKYPNHSTIDIKRISTSKRGVFQSEIDQLKKIANDCGLLNKGFYKRHPLSFLVEAADSICYLVMDIEDGYNKGWYDFEDIKQYFIDIEGIKERIEKLEEKHKGYGYEIARMVNFRIYLISRLVQLAINEFVQNYETMIKGNYNTELIEGDPLSRALRSFCKKNIFPKREILSLELTGHSVISGLLDYYINCIFAKGKDYKKRAIGLISDSIIRAALLENDYHSKDDFVNLDDYYKLRVIVDFISGMTDQFALEHYQKLSGQKIN